MGEKWRNTGAMKTVWNAVPEAIVELVHCKCKNGCKANACGWKITGASNKYMYCYDISDDEE